MTGVTKAINETFRLTKATTLEPFLHGPEHCSYGLCGLIKGAHAYPCQRCTLRGECKSALWPQSEIGIATELQPKSHFQNRLGSKLLFQYPFSQYFHILGNTQTSNHINFTLFTLFSHYFHIIHIFFTLFSHVGKDTNVKSLFFCIFTTRWEWKRTSKHILLSTSLQNMHLECNSTPVPSGPPPGIHAKHTTSHAFMWAQGPKGLRGPCLLGPWLQEAMGHGVLHPIWLLGVRYGRSTGWPNTYQPS
jgi:hypothetical protein